MDENRKKNIILEGVPDENSRMVDNNVVRNLLEYLGCGPSYEQITYVARLGQRRYRRNRLMMICFENERVANKLLQRSPDLRHNRNFERIYLKKDLPREQRPGFGKRSDNVAAESTGGRFEHTPTEVPSLTEVPTYASTSDTTAVIPTNENNNCESEYPQAELSIITSSSDWEGEDDSYEGTTSEDTDIENENWVTKDRIMGDTDIDSLDEDAGQEGDEGRSLFIASTPDQRRRVADYYSVPVTAIEAALYENLA